MKKLIFLAICIVLAMATGGCSGSTGGGGDAGGEKGKAKIIPPGKGTGTTTTKQPSQPEASGNLCPSSLMDEIDSLYSLVPGALIAGNMNGVANHCYELVDKYRSWDGCIKEENEKFPLEGLTKQCDRWRKNKP